MVPFNNFCRSPVSLQILSPEDGTGGVFLIAMYGLGCYPSEGKANFVVLATKLFSGLALHLAFGLCLLSI